MLPRQYQWLNKIGVLPRMVSEGLKELGTVETPGSGNTPKIMAWAREVNLEAHYSADSIPWCGLFVAVIAMRAGKTPPPGPLWALNWMKWGNDAGQPELGDVICFVRPGGGHVGIYICEDNATYHVLGGNQSDAVTITRIEKHRFKGARNLYKIGAPASARPYIIGAGLGVGVISSNEQ